MKRPPIPEPVKRAAIYLNMSKNGGRLICAQTFEAIGVSDLLTGRVHFDHNPPLGLRRRNSDGTYWPNANAVGCIEIVSVEGHSIRTNKKRGLYHGDQTQIAKVKRISGETPPKPKRKWPSRPFPKPKEKQI